MSDPDLTSSGRAPVVVGAAVMFISPILRIKTKNVKRTVTAYEVL